MAPTAAKSVRAVFAAVLIAFVAQIAVRVGVGEPYPGLFQPAFAGSPQGEGFAYSVQPRITVHFADGSDEHMDVRTLLPATSIIKSGVFRAAFFEGHISQDSRTKTWLRNRIASLGLRSQAQAMTVRWVEVKYPTSSTKPPVVRDIKKSTIDLTSP